MSFRIKRQIINITLHNRKKLLIIKKMQKRTQKRRKPENQTYNTLTP